MLLEQIVDLTKRINKRNRDKLVRQGQSDKVPIKILDEIRARKLGAKNRARKLEDEITKATQQKKDRLNDSDS